MYSLPSTSHTWHPLPRCRYLGATPRTNCPGPLASVCVPAGINPAARAQRASDWVIVGSGCSCGSVMVANLPELAEDPRREARAAEALMVEHCGEEGGLEPARAEMDRMHPAGHAVAQQHLGDDRSQAAGAEVVLDRHREARAADRFDDRLLVDRRQGAQVHQAHRNPLLFEPHPSRLGLAEQK